MVLIGPYLTPSSIIRFLFTNTHPKPEFAFTLAHCHNCCCNGYAVNAVTGSLPVSAVG